MKNYEKMQIANAFARLESGMEPTAEDWKIFRKIHRKFIVMSKEKKALHTELYNHLMDHRRDELNVEEAYTLRCILHRYELGDRIMTIVGIDLIVLTFIYSFHFVTVLLPEIMMTLL